MPRDFDVPSFYSSPLVLAVKNSRAQQDPKKKDLSPSILDFGPVKFFVARHFGFCFGVENAIETAYRVIRENPSRRIFLLSEMIHNPMVNQDLADRGVRFLMDTAGNRLIDFSTLNSEDIVIVPAFGTTLELQNELKNLGIDPYQHDATCPFVEKVWKRAEKLGLEGFTVIVHGKRKHEETRATFSHSKQNAPTLVILNMEEAATLSKFVLGKMTRDEFLQRFSESCSADFDPDLHLTRIGVVNQTTMLASETHEIAEFLKQTLKQKFGEANLDKHFADTRDTLCYATYENQSAAARLRDSGANLALVVGGYNSSNTSHLVELCEERMPTYYICGAHELASTTVIRHYNMHQQRMVETQNWLPDVKPLIISITAGASCPDVVVEAVINRIVEFFDTDSILKPEVGSAHFFGTNP